MASLPAFADAHTDPLYAALGAADVEALDAPRPSTLDESVVASVARDASAVWAKTRCVLGVDAAAPEAAVRALGEWDAVGVGASALTLACALALRGGAGSDGGVFPGTLAVVCGGTAAAAANVRVLGYTRGGLLHWASLLGYAVLPLAAGALPLCLIPRGAPLFVPMAVCVCAAGAIVGLRAAWTAIGATDRALADRQVLAVFPVALLFFSLSVMIVAL